ncbi:MAG: hypothetical protein HOE32_00120 [Nitrospina sp.]|nr:hypothetical protein [Nitrospina sp.]
MQRDNYFRVTSYVIVDGESLADMLFEADMAIIYDGGEKVHKWCNPINEKKLTLLLALTFIFFIHSIKLTV